MSFICHLRAEAGGILRYKASDDEQAVSCDERPFRAIRVAHTSIL